MDLAFSSKNLSSDDRSLGSSEKSTRPTQPWLLNGSVHRKRLSKYDECPANKKLKSTLPTHGPSMDDESCVTSVTGLICTGINSAREGQDEGSLDPAWEVIDSWEGDDSLVESGSSQGLSSNLGLPKGTSVDAAARNNEDAAHVSLQSTASTTSSLDITTVSDEEHESDFFSCLSEISGHASSDEKGSDSFIHSNLQPQSIDTGSSPSVSKSLPAASLRFKLKKMRLVLCKVDRWQHETRPCLLVRIQRPLVGAQRDCCTSDSQIDNSVSDSQINGSVSDLEVGGADGDPLIDDSSSDMQSVSTSQCKSQPSSWENETDGWSKVGETDSLTCNDTAELCTLKDCVVMGMDAEIVAREEEAAKGDGMVVVEEHDDMEEFAGEIEAEGPVANEVAEEPAALTDEKSITTMDAVQAEDYPEATPDFPVERLDNEKRDGKIVDNGEIEVQGGMTDSPTLPTAVDGGSISVSMCVHAFAKVVHVFRPMGNRLEHDHMMVVSSL